MKAYKLELYDRYYYFELLREPWLKTKYLNSNDAIGLFEQSNLLNLNSAIIFEQSIINEEKYVCVKVLEEMRNDFKPLK